MFRYLFRLIVLILLSSAILPCSPSHAGESCEAGSQVTIIGQYALVSKRETGGFALVVTYASPCNVLGVYTSSALPKECNTHVWFIASGRLASDFLTLQAENISCQSEKPSEPRRSESSGKNPVTDDQGHWLVIAGAWPQSESYKVKARVALLSGNNIAAKVINTDEYANLAPGLRAVVLGPASREQAEVQLATIKSIVPDAYIKEGF